MSENKNIPVYEFIIDEEKLKNNEAGLTAISIVDEPAILVDFMMFENGVDPMELKFSNEQKNELVGPLMVPGMRIYRNDSEGEYYGFFSEKTCERMTEDVMQKGLTKNFSLMHNGKKVEGAFLKEIWLEKVNAQSIVVDPKSQKGFDLPKGTPMANVKITPELRAYINQHGLKGFSIECFADSVRVFAAERCNITDKDVQLTKIRQLIINDDFENDEIKLSKDTFSLEYWNKKCSCLNCRELKAMGYQLPNVLPDSRFIKKYKIT